MGEMQAFKATIEFTYLLPADPEERERLYETTDPIECLRIDLDNDPAFTLLDAGEDILPLTIEEIAP